VKFKTLRNQFMRLKHKPQVCVLDSLFSSTSTPQTPHTPPPPPPPPPQTSPLSCPLSVCLLLMRCYDHQSLIASLEFLFYLVHNWCCGLVINIVKALLLLNLLISQYGALGYLKGAIYVYRVENVEIQLSCANYKQNRRGSAFLKVSKGTSGLNILLSIYFVTIPHKVARYMVRKESKMIHDHF
jgi:hypothetical protein